jgi:hypothetical protein
MCLTGQPTTDPESAGGGGAGSAGAGSAGARWAPPSSTGEALAALQAGLSYLASADPAQLTIAEQADCLRALATAEAIHVATTASVLTAFTAQAGYTDDGQGTAKSWLRWQTRITTGAAAGAVGWMRRLEDHPPVAAALAAGRISPSWARQICDWSDRLPQEQRADGDAILLDAAFAGCELADLSGLAEEMYRRSVSPDIDKLNDGFADRDVRLTPHFRGAAKLDGNLTPECAAALHAVLDALGSKAGPEDHRSLGQRNHDALEQMCKRLITAGGLPDRAGQPTQIQLHMTIKDLLGLDGADEAAAEWAGRGAAAAAGSECDASIVPVVTGHVDDDLLDRLASLFLRDSGPAGGERDSANGSGAGENEESSPDHTRAKARSEEDTSAIAVRAARDLILSRAVALLSGPTGLAAHLRARLLQGPAASVSLPLDIGRSTDIIPVHLRRAIVRRDKHCAFPGCEQPPPACDVHHIIPRSEGGPTTLRNCLLLCHFHHKIAIHRWCWIIRLHEDGTTSATRPGGRTIYSHAPVAA